MKNYLYEKNQEVLFWAFRADWPLDIIYKKRIHFKVYHSLFYKTRNFYYIYKKFKKNSEKVSLKNRLSFIPQFSWFFKELSFLLCIKDLGMIRKKTIYFLKGKQIFSLYSKSVKPGEYELKNENKSNFIILFEWKL